VPLPACSKRPTRRRSAPVNAPRSCPKSSASRSDSARAAQWRLTKGPAAAVDRPGDRALARPALAGDEDGRARRRDLRREPVDLLHRRARADHLAGSAGIGLAIAARAAGVASTAPRVDPPNADQERFEVDRLRHQILGAGADRVDRRAHVGEGGEDDDRDRGRDVLKPREKTHPVEARHHQIGDDEVGPETLRDEVERLLSVAGRGDDVARRLEETLERIARRRVVVDDEHLPAGAHPGLPECRSRFRGVGDAHFAMRR
jgi:hypothetical protein